MTAPLHVGLNLIAWTERAGGVHRYASELVPALLMTGDVRLTAFVSSDAPDVARAAPWAGELRWIVSRRAAGGGGLAPLARLGDQWAAQPFRARGLDVIHGLANVAPLWAGAVARVVTLHDLIWLDDRRSMGTRASLAMRVTALPSAWRADRIITSARASKEDVCARLRIDRARVDVVPLGIADRPPAAAEAEGVLRERYSLGTAPVVLCVAQKRAHKNLDGLVRALATLADRRTVLVMPGAPTPYEETVRALAAELGVAERVRLPGWLTDAEIEGLYALADVFCLPSREEGFGLPILEAMRRGTPVACSDRSTLPEVAGDAAELFDPDDPAAIAAALDRLLASPERRRELAARGRERCSQFTWQRSAELTLDTYRRAIAER